MNRSTFILFFNLSIALSACSNFENSAKEFVNGALSDTTYTLEIPQEIGGILLCTVHYWDDFHSYDYDIEYFYDSNTNNDSLIFIGSGSYSGKEWKKNEKIVTVGDWNILRTSHSRDSDKLLIGRTGGDSIWNEYIFSPETIEQNSFWKSKKIDSSPNYYDSVVEIEEVTEEGQIIVVYKYAIKDRWFSFMTSERKLSFELDLKTGEPELIEIREK